MTQQEKQERIDRMVELYMQGKTYRQIGEIMGLSRQMVFNYIGGDSRVRYFKMLTPEMVVYTGLREWMNTNKVNRAEFTRLLHNGVFYAANYNRCKRILCGEAIPTKSTIDKMLTITGLTYEEMFRRDDDATP
jgi:hypothetical protein